MKKVISIFILAVTLITTGTAFESHAAPKATKSSSKKKSASVIGKFTDGYSTYSLLSNGKLQISVKDRSIKIKGNYKKVNGGEYYKLFDHCASGCDGDASYIIVGNEVYRVSASSEFYISDFTYNPKTKEIKITEISGFPVKTKAELDRLTNEFYDSLYIPLSSLEKEATVHWTK